MDNCSYLNAFRDECRKMDPIRDTYEKVTTRTGEQFTLLSPRPSERDQKEMKKIYEDALAAALVQAGSVKE